MWSTLYNDLVWALEIGLSFCLTSRQIVTDSTCSLKHIFHDFFTDLHINETKCGMIDSFISVSRISFFPVYLEQHFRKYKVYLKTNLHILRRYAAYLEHCE